MRKTSELHKLLNRERAKHGLTHMQWNQELWRGCKRHCDYMLRTRRLVHAPVDDIPSGGECICGGKDKYSARAIVKSWMNSSRHKALILSSNVRSHAVAVSGGKHGAYATWRGSNETAHAPSKLAKLLNFFKILLGIK